MALIGRLSFHLKGDVELSRRLDVLSRPPLPMHHLGTLLSGVLGLVVSNTFCHAVEVLGGTCRRGGGSWRLSPGPCPQLFFSLQDFTVAGASAERHPPPHRLYRSAAAHQPFVGDSQFFGFEPLLLEIGLVVLLAIGRRRFSDSCLARCFSQAPLLSLGGTNLWQLLVSPCSSQQLPLVCPH